MKRDIIVEENIEWLSAHAKDNAYPLDIVKAVFRNNEHVEIIDGSAFEFTIQFDSEFICYEEIINDIKLAFIKVYPNEDFNSILKFTLKTDYTFNDIENLYSMFQDGINPDVGLGKMQNLVILTSFVENAYEMINKPLFTSVYLKEKNEQDKRIYIISLLKKVLSYITEQGAKFFATFVGNEEYMKRLDDLNSLFVKYLNTDDPAMYDKVNDECREIEYLISSSFEFIDDDEPIDIENINKEDNSVVLKDIDSLIGADEFKKLVAEILLITPVLVRYNCLSVFYSQSYLFSIGDGNGLTTYCKLFSRLLSSLDIIITKEKPVIEIKVSQMRENRNPFYEVIETLEENQFNGFHIVCIDISEWMENTSHNYFKGFLKELRNYVLNNIFIFRIPFIEKDLQEKILLSLNDLLFIRSVSFPPFSREELTIYLNNELRNYGFTPTNNCYNPFFNRILKEKSDGKFYGLCTMNKVIKELVYFKHLENAKKILSEKYQDLTIISKKDTMKLCDNSYEEMTGFDMLDSLVGMEFVKEKVKEIIAQIEYSVKQNNVDRPCIHMYFTGNPGTGKTTVARIIGKILKEKGILRVGNFYECGGRDLCGRYIGETSPKTTSICRDAYGSVLFIDEAYSLYRGDTERDYGKEALDTLVAQMENHRNDFVVILAGYTDDMENLLKGNTGLRSRLPYHLNFPNYNQEQLFEIYCKMLKSKFKYDDSILDSAKQYFLSIPNEVIENKEFSNARFVRNLFERTWAKAAMRSEINKEKIIITKDDFECASKEKEFTFNSVKKKIGF